MRNMLAFVGAIVVTVGGVGYYLDWYQVRSNPSLTGQRSFNIDINTNKIGDDLHKGTAKVQDVLDKRRQEAEAKLKAEAAKLDPSKGIKVEIKKGGTEEESEPFIINFGKQ